MSYIMLNKETIGIAHDHMPPNVFSVFVYLLRNANYADCVWGGLTVKRGQLVTSIGSIAARVHLSIQQTRTAIETLISDGEIEKTATSKYTVITVINYDTYNNAGEQEQQTNNIQVTNKQQQDNKYNKDIKNNKKGVNIEDYINSCGKTEFLCSEFLECWNEWQTFRSEIKKPLTPTAIKKQLQMLLGKNVATAIAMIEQSIRNQWQGIFELKEKHNGTTTGVQINKRGTQIVTDFSPEALKRASDKRLRALGLPVMDERDSQQISTGTGLKLIG